MYQYEESPGLSGILGIFKKKKKKKKAKRPVVVSSVPKAIPVPAPIPVQAAPALPAPEPITTTASSGGGATPVMSFADSSGNPVDVNEGSPDSSVAVGSPPALSPPLLIALAVGAYLLLKRR